MGKVPEVQEGKGHPGDKDLEGILEEEDKEDLEEDREHLGAYSLEDNLVGDTDSSQQGTTVGFENSNGLDRMDKKKRVITEEKEESSLK